VRSGTHGHGVLGEVDKKLQMLNLGPNVEELGGIAPAELAMAQHAERFPDRTGAAQRPAFGMAGKTRQRDHQRQDAIATPTHR